MTDFEALYARYCRDVHRFALYLCGNSAEADDIAAETFARAWSGSGEVRAVSAKAYLFTIARNYYLEGLRHRMWESPLNVDMPDSNRDLHADAESRIELERVLAALRQFPEIDRTVLLLRVQEGMPYREIADTVCLSLAAVKVKIHRARLRLAQWRTSQEADL
jgi:RNA polymerase sigma-70 factor, ECF subfamily